MKPLSKELKMKLHHCKNAASWSVSTIARAIILRLQDLIWEGEDLDGYELDDCVTKGSSVLSEAALGFLNESPAELPFGTLVKIDSQIIEFGGHYAKVIEQHSATAGCKITTDAGVVEIPENESLVIQLLNVDPGQITVRRGDVTVVGIDRGRNILE
jgi:hypothetical protein